MRIYMKIGGGFLVLILLISLVGGISYYSASDSAAGFGTYRTMARGTASISKMQIKFLGMQGSVKDYVLHAGQDDIDNFRMYSRELTSTLQELHQIPSSAEKKALLVKVERKLSEFEDHFSDIIKLTATYTGHFDTIVRDSKSIEEKIRTVFDSTELSAEMRLCGGDALRLLLETRVNVIYYTFRKVDSYMEAGLKTLEALLHKVEAFEGFNNSVVNCREVAELIRSYRSHLESMAQCRRELDGQVRDSIDVIGPEINTMMNDMVTDIKAEQDTVGPRMVAMNETAVKRVIFFSLVALIVALVFAVLITRGITLPVAEAVAMANEIRLGLLKNRVRTSSGDEIGDLCRALNSMADNLEERVALLESVARGDLTRNVKMASDGDAFGRALQSMLEQLREMMSGIMDMSENADASASQLADASQSLSQGAAEQASSIEEITSSVTEIGSQARTNADNALQATRLAVEARESADKGNGDMTRMIDSMHKIGDSSQKMAGVIKAIDDIAFQTNLLALNAAVEAARAGKYGKGFAVVAQEVRDLAGRSARAAKETAELIESSIAQINDGSNIAGATASSLMEIHGSVIKAADLVEEIAASSKEQAMGIDQIIQALSQIEIVTQQSTASAEETASAAEEIAGNAATLMEQVRKFRL